MTYKLLIIAIVSTYLATLFEKVLIPKIKLKNNLAYAILGDVSYICYLFLHLTSILSLVLLSGELIGKVVS